MNDKRKSYIIDEKEVVVDADNVLYSGIAGTDNVAGALDDLDERIVSLEGSSSEVVTEGATPLSNNDRIGYDLLRVFEKDNFVASTAWELYCQGFYASEKTTIAANTPVTVCIEAQAGTESLGANAITNTGYCGIAGRYTVGSGLSFSHVWDGTKDIYTATHTSGNSVITDTNELLQASGQLTIGIHGANGKNLKIAAYLIINGIRFNAKLIKYSATSDSSSMTLLPYRTEWPDVATTVDKVHAIIDDSPFIACCSGSSEYNPFLSVNTTPRVILTIVSDDGESRDWYGLHQYFKSASEANNIEIRWSIAIPSNFIVFNETTRPIDGSSSDRLTVRQVRELVGKYGVSVLCHNYNHEVLSSIESADEQEAIMLKARRQIERQIGVPCIHHCLPGGGSNSATWTVLPRHFLSTALVENGINIPADLPSKSGYANNSANDNSPLKVCRYTISTIQYTNYVEVLEQAQAIVQETGRSAWVVYLTHGQEWVPYHDTIQAITEYCIENDIAMRNYSEAYAEIYPAKDKLKQILGIS